MTNPRDREVSKGVVVNPHRMGGTPTIQGTRISAEMVVNLMAGDNPVSAITLIEDYGLTYGDLSNAAGWEKKGRPR